MSAEPELPPVDDVTRPWWDATRERTLLIQKCLACGHLQHYPRALCTHCGATELGWAASVGRGTVDAFTVVHRGLPGFPAPYVVARIRLDEGVLLLFNVFAADGTASDGEGVACDAPVELRWSPLPDGRHLPVFTPATLQEES